MADFPYAAVPNKLSTLLDKIQTVGVPAKADTSWLKTHGFKSSNDPSALRVLEFIGFIDSTKQPTDKWKGYRHKAKANGVLGAAIKEGYSVLYDALPEAHRRNEDDLENFFRVQSPKVGDQAISRTVKTFQALCLLADFSGTPTNGAVTSNNGHMVSASTTKPLVAPLQEVESAIPTLHIDFQVHIAADAPPEQIDKIFESMAKHLYGKVAE
ncbi:MAG: DUF5343 domain-containing protein [Chloroflexi bacterium]|nr:DUF5343 domain-containing protein [Chloroflexota bacterium]MCY4248186.1 DUF5343 domain-containing protein [Chloroflexota bacterium]